MITNLNARAPIGWAAYRRIDLVAMVKKHVPEKDRPEDLESMTKDTQLIPLLDGLVLQGKMPKPAYGTRHYQEMGDTAPHAICLAALRAVEVEP